MKQCSTEALKGATHLKHVSELLLKFGLRHVGTTRVNDVNDELAASQKRVVDELAGSDLHRSVGLVVDDV